MLSLSTHEPDRLVIKGLIKNAIWREAEPVAPQTL